MAQSHAILECCLVIRFCPLCFNVLLNCIDLRFILNEFLFNIIQAVVDITLQNLVLLGVVLHCMVSHLLLETRLILLKHSTYSCKAYLLTFEFNLKIVSLGELIVHFIFHLGDLFCNLLHLFFNTTLKSLDLLQIILSLFQFYLQPSVSSLCIFHLALLKSKLILLILELRCRW